jgi:hypothetical protein
VSDSYRNGRKVRDKPASYLNKSGIYLKICVDLAGTRRWAATIAASLLGAAVWIHPDALAPLVVALLAQTTLQQHRTNSIS